jgi:hypothetical protein
MHLLLLIADLDPAFTPALPRPALPCSDTRTRFLGTKAPKLFSAAVRGERAMLALSSRPWLGYSDQGKFNLVPMSYEPLDFASGGWGLAGDVLFGVAGFLLGWLG